MCGNWVFQVLFSNLFKMVVREEVVFLNLRRVEGKGWCLAFYRDFEQGKFQAR